MVRPSLRVVAMLILEEEVVRIKLFVRKTDSFVRSLFREADNIFF